MNASTPEPKPVRAISRLLHQQGSRQASSIVGILATYATSEEIVSGCLPSSRSS